MSNFEFLKDKKKYALFAPACMEAEKIYATAPAMCAVGCHKALELAVKWVYAADNTMEMPYKDNLQSLVHEPSFRFAVDEDTWRKFQFIIRLGNLAMRWRRCALCLSLWSGSITVTAQTIRSAPLTCRRFQKQRSSSIRKRSRSRRVCWIRRTTKSRRCVSRRISCKFRSAIRLRTVTTKRAPFARSVSSWGWDFASICW